MGRCIGVLRGGCRVCSFERVRGYVPGAGGERVRGVVSGA
jgi:hypothetical protein